MNHERRTRHDRPAGHPYRPDGAPDAPDMRNDDRPAFVPTITPADVYYEMIATELRHGRLTPSRRKRIIRYAAQLGLSAVEAGRLITACREQALHSDDPVERGHAWKLVESAPEKMPIAFKLAIVVSIALLIDILVIVWSL